MKIFVLLLATVLALSDARVFEPEVVETRTRWMDRKFTGESGRITNGQPGEILIDI